MCVLDADGVVVQLNPAWEKKLNLVRTDIEQSHYLAWVHPDDKASSRDKLAQLDITMQSQHDTSLPETAHRPVETHVAFSNRWRDCSAYYHWLHWEISAVQREGEIIPIMN